MNRRPASVLLAAFAALFAVAAPAQDEPEDRGALLQAAQKKLRRGEWSAAEAQLDELFDALAEQDESKRPSELVAGANATLWRLELRRGRYEAVQAGFDLVAVTRFPWSTAGTSPEHKSRSTGESSVSRDVGRSPGRG